MRSIVLIGLLLLCAGLLVAVPIAANGNGNAGKQVAGVNASGHGGDSGAGNVTGDNETVSPGQGAGKNKSNEGISGQVQQIMEERKNGTINVPQGILVSIIAKNHSMSVEDAVLALNETINANVTVNGKQRELRIEPDTDTVNITDENITVETDGNISIVNDSLSVDEQKVLVMPSEVPSKISAKTIKSAVLHVVSGDPVYQVNATKSAKVLWIFDSDMDVESTLDAATGHVKNENRPWWSFLVTSEG